MQLLHPFMPFVTEEIYHQLKERNEGDDLTIRQAAEIKNKKQEILKQAELLKQVITALRDVRIKNQLRPKEEIKLQIQTSDQAAYNSFKSILAKQVNASEITFANEQHRPQSDRSGQEDQENCQDSYSSFFPAYL